MGMHSILFVDDEPGILRTLERMFRREGHELLFATSAEEALALLRSREIDLIISDYRMPGADGIELMKKVRETSPDTIRVILTGYANFDTVIKAINEGHVFQFITKPWKDEEFRLIIRRCLEQVDLQKENRALQEHIQKQNELLRELNADLENRVLERTRELTLHNQALKLSQNILHNLPIPLFGISLEGIVVMANRAGTELFKLENRIIGGHYENVFPAEINGLLREAESGAAFEGRTFQVAGEKYRVSVTPVQLSQEQKGILLLFIPGSLKVHAPVQDAVQSSG